MRYFSSLLSMQINNDRLESLLRSEDYITRSDLESIGYSRSAAVEKINSLIGEGRIERSGGGRSTKYRVLE